MTPAHSLLSAPAIHVKCLALLTSVAAAGPTTVDDILHREICGGPFASALDVHTIRQSGSGSHGPA